MNSNLTSRMPMLAGVGLALAAFLLLLPAPVHADTLNVTDDAFVKGTSGGNFGSRQKVKVMPPKVVLVSRSSIFQSWARPPATTSTRRP